MHIGLLSFLRNEAAKTISLDKQVFSLAWARISVEYSLNTFQVARIHQVSFAISGAFSIILEDES